MATAPEFTEAIRAEIAAKVKQLTSGNCPMGHPTNWRIMGGYSRVQFGAGLKSGFLSQAMAFPAPCWFAWNAGTLRKWRSASSVSSEEDPPPARQHEYARFGRWHRARGRPETFGDRDRRARNL